MPFNDVELGNISEMHYNISDIKKNIIGKLKKNLPDHLTYHNVEHTLYVVDKSAFISKKEKISAHDKQLVYIAALYHDSGFMIGPKDHEETSCKIARKDLKNIVSKEDLDKICGMIMATKIPQNPQTHCERILADADLEYLGTKSFWETGDLLYKEIKHFNSKFSINDWNKLQVSFLENHQYKTSFCRQYREKYKKKHLKRLKRMVK
ncbi:MAG: HD domain-containing protein [Saprospiraceae bacterium]|nr:HD domain-containing protein [Bacteroidia bacterium]NNE13348.1 HD domain-containing protein [Saprospiraceae bacterium]NNL91049.1 HD domain-containing protein [Saprospiraceae bacterium]